MSTPVGKDAQGLLNTLFGSKAETTTEGAAPAAAKPLREGKLDPVTERAVTGICAAMTPTPELQNRAAKPPKTTEDGTLRTWFSSKINSVLTALAVPVEKWDAIEDAVMGSALAGKLGDGQPSETTASAIADMIHELAGVTAAPSPGPATAVAVTDPADAAPTADVIPPTDVGAPADAPPLDGDELPPPELEPEERGGDPEVPEDEMTDEEFAAILADLDAGADEERNGPPGEEGEGPEEPDPDGSEEHKAEEDEAPEADEEGKEDEEDDTKSKGKKEPKDDVDPEELKMGIETEKEHTDDPAEQEKIARDHLAEIPDYYTRLTKMEKGAKKDVKNEAIEAYGRKGMANKRWRKFFKNWAAMEKWCEVNNAEVEGTREATDAEMITMREPRSWRREAYEPVDRVPDLTGLTPRAQRHKLFDVEDQDSPIFVIKKAGNTIGQRMSARAARNFLFDVEPHDAPSPYTVHQIVTREEAASRSTEFGDVPVGSQFDFVSDAPAGINYTSFWKTCIKTGPRTYRDEDGQTYRVGSIHAKVFHVVPRKEDPYLHPINHPGHYERSSWQRHAPCGYSSGESVLATVGEKLVEGVIVDTNGREAQVDLGNGRLEFIPVMLLFRTALPTGVEVETVAKRTDEEVIALLDRIAEAEVLEMDRPVGGDNLGHGAARQFVSSFPPIHRGGR